MPTTCTCGRHWTGYNQCHCTVCHEHFSSVVMFDKHKPSRHGCGDPRTMTSKTGTTVFRADEGPFGTTWTDARRNTRYANDAQGANGGAA